MFFKRMYERQKRWLGYLANQKSVSSDGSNVSSKYARFSKFLGFTLVELIVVISILAILGTIGFISIGGYSSKSRDSVRLSDLATASKGMETYRITAGTYPIPDSVYGTGQIGGVTLSSVGYLGDSASSLIRMDKVPLDPLSKTKYAYGVDIDRRQYQIGVTVENPYALGSSRNLPLAYEEMSTWFVEGMIPSAHAANASYQARVSGTYAWIVKIGTTLYNPPSLLFSNTGTVDLSNTTTRFVYHKGENLPYAVSGSVPGSKTPSEVLSAVGSTATSLTWITLTDWKAQSGTLATNLGYPVDTVWVTYYGSTKYYAEVVQGNVSGETPAPVEVLVSGACTNLPTNAVFYGNASSYTLASAPSGTSLSATGAGYQASPTVNTCQWTCGSGYLYSGGNCVTPARGAQPYTSPGTYTWTVPAWVASVSVVCVGGGGGWASEWGWRGGGGGWALAYKNNISVSAGQTYTITIWAGGRESRFNWWSDVTNGEGGGASSFTGNGISFAANGGQGWQGSSGGNGGSPSGAYTGWSSGGNGGAGPWSGGGGGGAGGYGGNGLTGTSNTNGGGGGGVWLMGGSWAGGNGWSWSGGSGAAGWTSGDASSSCHTGYGGAYGWGGAGANCTGSDGQWSGGSGACRIIWPGTTRQFPSTDAWA